VIKKFFNLDRTVKISM